MNKKCNTCGDDFVSTTEEKEYCSNTCFMEYINSEEFDIELEKMLDINIENWLKHQLRQAMLKVGIYSKQVAENSAKLMDKIGYPGYNEFINSLTSKNEEGNNI
jgi:hypothetical protein